MHKEGDEVHVSTEEASGGRQEGVVRWILAGGLVLVIVLLSVTWITGAWMQGDVEEEATVSGAISSMEEDGDGTDSIVGVPSASDSDETMLDDDTTTTEEGLEVIEN